MNPSGSTRSRRPRRRHDRRQRSSLRREAASSTRHARANGPSFVRARAPSRCFARRWASKSTSTRSIPRSAAPATPGRLVYHHYQDFNAWIASGSFPTAGMVIIPCSMSTLAAIAAGTTTQPDHARADVHLKERRKLILVPRETPLSLIHLENMVKVTRAGAVVLPAMPGWYHRPRQLRDLIDFVVGRICDQLAIKNTLMPRWGTAKQADPLGETHWDASIDFDETERDPVAGSLSRCRWTKALQRSRPPGGPDHRCLGRPGCRAGAGAGSTRTRHTRSY